MPCRLGASGSVRASSRHQSACIAPLAHTFWPLTTNRSPSWRAAVRSDARSEPASGSEKPCTQISPSRMAGRWRRRCSSVPAASRVAAAWWIADERQHQPRRVVGGQLLIQHDLLGHAHSAAPLRRPMRHRVSGPVQFGEPGLLEVDERGRRRRRSGRPASRPGCGWHTSRVPRPGTPRGSPEQPAQRVATQPVGQVLAGGRQAPRAAAAAVGCGATTTTAWSRRRIRPRRAAGGTPGKRPRPPRWRPAATPAHRRRRARCGCCTARNGPASPDRCVPPRRR